MRRLLPALAAIGTLAALATALPAQERPESAVDPEQEGRALAFARDHHPELADLLGPLRTRDRAAYDEAIRELDRAREAIERQRRRDPGRAALALASWKAGSRVDLITARLISRPDPGRERDLRLALADQIRAQLELQTYDRERLRERLAQLDEQIDRLERRGDALVQARFDAALKKVQRVRRRGEGGPPAVSAAPPAERPDPRGDGPR